ncbi:hypothetical protein AVEN_123263-1 [Araneus ventricosus]|uniref:Uncharacterized protein n=1 Tax=Araneus ventricosus TaxID=182803 RepID=A0A4Y2P9Y1_ARAVE|nr:hypothetical protein AVEN_97703-1 [Araneus ventricosus]GBN47047.1 hypothetical protein AVEN_123263-1 [Araneus ventricosus]
MSIISHLNSSRHDINTENIESKWQSPASVESPLIGGTSRQRRGSNLVLHIIIISTVISTRKRNLVTYPATTHSRIRGAPFGKDNIIQNYSARSRGYIAKLNNRTVGISNMVIKYLMRRNPHKEVCPINGDGKINHPQYQGK